MPHWPYRRRNLPEGRQSLANTKESVHPLLGESLGVGGRMCFSCCPAGALLRGFHPRMTSDRPFRTWMGTLYGWPDERRVVLTLAMKKHKRKQFRFREKGVFLQNQNHINGTIVQSLRSESAFILGYWHPKFQYWQERRMDYPTGTWIWHYEGLEDFGRPFWGW